MSDDHEDEHDLDYQGYEIGDVVTVRPDFGDGADLIVVIEGFGAKNGCPLFEYTIESGPHWAYLTQITARAKRHGEAA